MATQILCRRTLPKSLTLSSFFSRSISTSAHTPSPFRTLAAASSLRRDVFLPSPSTFRSFSTRATTSSLNDPSPNWSNRPPKETILLDGCDFEHWLVLMEKPEGEPTRDEIIDSYIKTLAKVVGSEEEARMKIYSVSTRHYYAFGALVSEELSFKLKELDRVCWVLPDSYLNVKEKDYGVLRALTSIPQAAYGSHCVSVNFVSQSLTSIPDPNILARFYSEFGFTRAQWFIRSSD